MRQVNLHIEGVPNPHAIKFVLENGMLTQEPYEFRIFSDTGYSPLARKLMMLKYIDRVLIFKNHITVLKLASAEIEWEAVLPEIRNMISTHLGNNEPILYLGITERKHVKTDDELLEMIGQILDRHIRPAAQEDGGDILIESFENGVLKVSLAGSCHGCPYVSTTVNQGLFPVVKQFVPELQEVVWK